MYVLLYTGLLCFSCLQNRILLLCATFVSYLMIDDCHSPITVFRTSVKKKNGIQNFSRIVLMQSDDKVYKLYLLP
jgi:hypothetical protein